MSKKSTEINDPDVENETELTDSEAESLKAEFDELSDSMPEVDPHIEFLEKEVKTLVDEVAAVTKELETITRQINDNTAQLALLKKTRDENDQQDNAATDAINALDSKNKNTTAYKDAHKRFIETRKASEAANQAYEKFNQSYEETQGKLKINQADTSVRLQQVQKDLTQARQDLTSAQKPSTMFSRFNEGISNARTQSALDNMQIDEDLDELSSITTEDLNEQQIPDNNSESSDAPTVVKPFQAPKPRRSSLEIVESALETAKRDLVAIKESIINEITKDVLNITQLEEKEAICKANVIKTTKIFQSMSITSYYKSEYAAARTNKNNAERELKEATRAIDEMKTYSRTHQETLLNTKNAIEENLTTLQKKYDAILDGQEINIYESIGTYSFDTDIMNFNESIKEERILSRYEDEKPDIEDEKVILDKRKESLGTLFKTLKTTQEDLEVQTKDLTQIGIRRDALKKDIEAQRKRIDTNESLAKVFEIKGKFNVFMYHIGRFFLNNFVGRNTGKQDADNQVRLSKAVLDGMYKEQAPILLELKESEEKAVSSISTLREQEKECIASIGGDTLDSVDAQIQELVLLINRDKEPIIAALLKGCEVDNSMGFLRDKEDSASVNVKKALHDFIDRPTNYTLAKLEHTRAQNPDYTSNKQLTQLLEDAREIYPKIASVEGNKLSISVDQATALISAEIEKNEKSITPIQEKLETLSQQLSQNKENLKQQTAPIEQNKAALILCRRLLHIAEDTKRVHEKSTDEYAALAIQAANESIVFLQQKIKKIEQNVPKSVLKDIEKIIGNQNGTGSKYESSREQINSTLKLNKVGIVIPTSVALNEDTLTELLKDVDQDIRNKIWGDILKEYSTRIEIIEATITNLFDKKKSNIDNVYEAIELMSTAFDKAKGEPGQAEAIELLSTMVEQLEKSSVADSIKTIQTIKQKLNTFSPEIKGKFQDYFAHVNQMIDIALESSTEYLENSIFNENEPLDIIEDPALKSVNLKSLSQTCQQQEAEIEHLNHDITRLQTENQLLAQEKALVASGELPLTSMKQIDELIKQCGAIKSMGIVVKNSPVRIKLKYFLNDPSQDRLNTLKTAMENDPNYLKNTKLVSLVKQAGEFYPDIAKAHQAIVDKLNPNRSVDSCKQELESYGQAIAQQDDASTQSPSHPEEGQSLNIKH